MVANDDAGTGVHILAGTPPGGGQDRAARALAAAITTATGRQATVENLPGRGGGRSWEAVSQGTARVVAISSPTLVTNAIHDPSEPGVDDVSHVGHLCSEHLAFAVASDGPISDAGELLDAMRATGTSVAIATALGNVNHAAVSIVARAVGASPSSLQIGAHASARIAVSEVETQRSAVAVVSAASTFEGLERGTLRVVAVSAVERPRGILDGTPRWRDLEVDCALETWRGVVGPPDLSDDDIAEWDTTLDAALRSSAWHDALQRFAWIDARRNAAGAARFVAAEDGALRDALAGVAI